MQQSIRGPRRIVWTVLGLLVLAWGLSGLAGCTSDEPGVVGADIPGELDLNDPTVVKVRTLADTGSLTLEDPEKPFDQFEVLYFGHLGDESSSMLARYDFSSLQDSVGQDVVINEANIESVTLRLFRMAAYEPTDTTASAVVKEFEVWTSPIPSIPPCTPAWNRPPAA